MGRNASSKMPYGYKNIESTATGSHSYVGAHQAKQMSSSHIRKEVEIAAPLNKAALDFLDFSAKKNGNGKKIMQEWKNGKKKGKGNKKGKGANKDRGSGMVITEDRVSGTVHIHIDGKQVLKKKKQKAKTSNPRKDKHKEEGLPSGGTMGLPSWAFQEGEEVPESRELFEVQDKKGPSLFVMQGRKFQEVQEEGETNQEAVQSAILSAWSRRQIKA